MKLGGNSFERIAGPPQGCLRLLLPALPVLLLSTHAQAQNIVQSQGEARVTLLQRLTLVKESDLDFGRVAPAPTPGTVTIDPANATCTSTGGVAATDCSSARFAGYGSANQIVTVRIPATAITLSGPGTPMTASNLTINTGPDLAFVGNILGFRIYRINSSSGVYDFALGGRLNVNANQAPGVYSGQFIVRVDYF